MYLVRNAASFQLFPERHTAEAGMQPGAELYVKVGGVPDDLELLYALAASLLQNSGINPLTLLIQVPKLDGTTDEVNAVSVMNRARQFIDSIQGIPS